MKRLKDFSAEFVFVEVDEVIEISDKMCETSQISANVVFTYDLDFWRVANFNNVLRAAFIGNCHLTKTQKQTERGN